jgi:hypothetical protein
VAEAAVAHVRPLHRQDDLGRDSRALSTDARLAAAQSPAIAEMLLKGTIGPNELPSIVDLPVQLAFQFSPLDVPNGPCVRATEAHRADDIYFSNLDTASECARARESGDWLGQRAPVINPIRARTQEIARRVPLDSREQPNDHPELRAHRFSGGHGQCVFEIPMGKTDRPPKR